MNLFWSNETLKGLSYKELCVGILWTYNEFTWVNCDITCHNTALYIGTKRWYNSLNTEIRDNISECRYQCYISKTKADSFTGATLCKALLHPVRHSRYNELT